MYVCMHWPFIRITERIRMILHTHLKNEMAIFGTTRKHPRMMKKEQNKKWIYYFLQKKREYYTETRASDRKW